MEFEQSRTYQNLLNAYNWELNISTQYSIFSDRARQDGFIEISRSFEVVSGFQKEHARIWLRRINNGQLPSTSDNLSYSAQIENDAGNQMYREYAQIASDEGFPEIAALFSGIANIELNHSLLFRQYYTNVERNEVFCKPQETLWMCQQCGNIMYGECAPLICPVCGFPQGFYRVYDSNSVR